MNKKPNVIVVLTDDQGYGDLACNGNPWIKTPNIDAFHDDCVHYEDFHVMPVCAPTRGTIMTGRRALRNGVWATCFGRSILKGGEYTMANMFQDNGYKTGMFGKWHLGDNYPYRPEDRGFERVVAHKGGGVGQTPDFWGNNYFDDTYFVDSKPTKFDGYCTDIWFDQAKKFITESKDEPFFAYIATNAPHGPFLVADKYTDMYKDNPDIGNPEFYGMITNIDENFGDLRKFLKETGIEDNTVLIFMTDNGSSDCQRKPRNEGRITEFYNAGMRGKKASYYDGGHRVPFLMRYPDGNLVGGRACNDLCMGLDMMPTFAEMCDLKLPEGLELDGRSFARTFKGEKMDSRTEFIQFRQNTDIPDKWTNAVIRDNYRLVYGKELYDIPNDPAQYNDISAEHPEIVAELRAAHEKWWDEIVEEVKRYAPIVLGNEAENPAKLNSMDVLGDIAWNQAQVSSAVQSCGIWYVNFDHAGDYSFALQRWPEEAKKTINEQMTQEEYDSTIAPTVKPFNTEGLIVKSAHMKLHGKTYSQDVVDDVCAITFDVNVTDLDNTNLEAWFINDKGEKYGAYYVDVLAK